MSIPTPGDFLHYGLSTKPTPTPDTNLSMYSRYLVSVRPISACLSSTKLLSFFATSPLGNYSHGLPPDTRHQTPDIRHQISDIGHQISDNRYQTSDIRHQTSDRYQISVTSIRHQTSDITLWKYSVQRCRTRLRRLATLALVDRFGPGARKPACTWSHSKTDCAAIREPNVLYLHWLIDRKLIIPKMCILCSNT